MTEGFSHIPAHLDARLQSFSELDYNWNSYGAGPISKWAITEARLLVEYGMRIGLPSPWIAPGSGGSVGIEWEIGDKLLYIDVEPPPSVVRYLITDDASGMEIEEELNERNRNDVMRTFRELLAGDNS